MLGKYKTDTRFPKKTTSLHIVSTFDCLIWPVADPKIIDDVNHYLLYEKEANNF